MQYLRLVSVYLTYIHTISLSTGQLVEKSLDM